MYKNISINFIDNNSENKKYLELISTQMLVLCKIPLKCWFYQHVNMCGTVCKGMENADVNIMLRNFMFCSLIGFFIKEESDCGYCSSSSSLFM